MSRCEVLVLSLLALVVVCIYSNTLRVPFVFDDQMNIRNNAAIRLTTLTPEAIAKAVVSAYRTRRPVAYMSFALNYYIHQYQVPGYHVVNILIHLTTGLWLYLFVRTTLRLPVLHSPEPTPVWIASWTVLLWLVQPLHTESVTFIVQRMTSLAAMFYMLALLLYVQARLTVHPRRRWGLFAGCAVAGLLALGCKEIAVTLPGFLLLYEWYFFQDLRPAWFKRAWPAVGGMVVFLALAARMHMGTYAVHKIFFSATQVENLSFTVTERVLTEWRVVLLYLRLLLVPHPSQLNLEHDFPLSHALFDPMSTVVALGTILGMLGLAGYLARRERLLSFCIVWFFGNLVLESSVIMLDLVFEHRTYLPSMLLSLLVVLVVVRALTHPWLRVGSLCAVALVYAVWTYERNGIWADPVTLWSDCVAKSPYKARPRWNLATVLQEQGRNDEAVQQYTAIIHHHLGDAWGKQDRGGEAKAHFLLAVSLQRLGQVEEAVHQYTAVVAAPRTDKRMEELAQASQRRMHLLMNQDNGEESDVKEGALQAAVGFYTETLRLMPDSAEDHNNLGWVLERQGKVAEAVQQYTEALRLEPHFGQAYLNLQRARRHLRAVTGPARPDLQP